MIDGMKELTQTSLAFKYSSYIKTKKDAVEHLNALIFNPVGLCILGEPDSDGFHHIMKGELKVGQQHIDIERYPETHRAFIRWLAGYKFNEGYKFGSEMKSKE